MWAADPYSDWLHKDSADAQWLDSRPECVCCGEPIQDEQALELEDGWMCLACVRHNIRDIPDEEDRYGY